MKETPMTVDELRTLLAHLPPDLHIFLEGCDCINRATKLWQGRPNSCEEYQGQLMLGFGPRDSYVTRGWRELHPNREPA